MSDPPRDRRLPGWLLDEVASAGRENLDADHVARYDGKMDSGAEAEVALLRTLGLDERSVVLELGTGTGQLALAVAAHCARVIAVDVSAVMLDRLRAKVEERGARNIELHEAGFLSYEHRGAPADVIYTRLALHHLPDAWKAIALSRLRGMLRPGGVVRLVDVVYDFDPAEAFSRLEAWCAGAGDEIVGEWARSELEEHVRDEHSTFTWLLEPMIVRAGFEIQDASYSGDELMASYILRPAQSGVPRLSTS